MKRFLLFVMLVTLCVTAVSYAAQVRQARTLTIYVVDESGEPIIGAFARIEETGANAISDAEGKIVLPLPLTVCHVNISYIGYQTLRLQVPDRPQHVVWPSAIPMVSDIQ